MQCYAPHNSHSLLWQDSTALMDRYQQQPLFHLCMYTLHIGDPTRSRTFESNRGMQNNFGSSSLSFF